MPLLHVRDLAKHYPQAGARQPVLDQLQLAIDAGESIAIVGRSGCGKSTLLNLIAGVDLPDHGDIIVNDTNLCQLTDKQRTLIRREQMGFVFQFFNLIPTLTVEENILLPLQLLGRASPRAEINAQLQTLGLADLRQRFPEQLSGGEQQRVALLRAMIHRPKLLLADEPTGNLDHHSGNQVAQLLFDSVAADSALLLVTHSEEIARQADRCFQLQDGRLKPLQLPHSQAVHHE